MRLQSHHHLLMMHLLQLVKLLWQQPYLHQRQHL
jgi:hypothetical protein